MTKTQWCILYLLFQCYLLLGAYMFYSIERPLEEERRELEKIERKEIQVLLDQHYEKGIPLAQVEILEKLESYCGKPFYINTFNLTREEAAAEPVNEKPFLWSFYNSFLFCLVTLSTIGYGNLAPTSRLGRMLDVLYGMVGIPFHGIVVVHMSEFFGSVFMKAHHRYKEEESRLSLFIDIIYYLIPGVIVFILFPAATFVYFENWYFDTGIYYAYVTLCTIGYGDLVAGQNGSQELSYQIFRMCVLIWIMFGLGYMVMLVGFITRAMRSKRVRKIEHKLANTIKMTQSRIWNEFTEDVTIIRRMLNEMYLLKFKPVYKDQKEVPPLGRKTRSQSAPNLTEWPVLRKKAVKESSSEDEEEVANSFKKQRLQRRRAYSENVMTPVITRIMSESDLSRIDRNATFGTAAVIEPGVLLARVVDALGTPIGSRFELSDDEDDTKSITHGKMNGIHGFSDSQILASERDSRWSIGGTRLRAVSAATPPFKRQSMPVFGEQRTWSGVDPQQVLRLAKMRSNGAVINQADNKSIRSSKSSVNEQNLQPPPSRMRRMSVAAMNFFSSSKNKSQDQKEKEKDTEKKRRTGNTRSLFPSMPSGKRLSLPEDEQPDALYEQINYLSHTSGRRPSLITTLANELGAKQAEGAIPISLVLEQTSVADLLRLISSLHARLDPTKSLTAQDLNLFPKRKSTRTTSTKESPFAALFAPLNDNKSGIKDENKSARDSSVSISNMAPHDRRRVSIVSPPQTAPQPRQPILRPGRRFSLIPPMDVDNPSGVRSFSRSSLIDRQRRSTSISPLVAGSNPNIAVPPVSKRLRRLSLAGSSRNIPNRSSLHREPPRQPKVVPPALVVTNPQGHKKFSIRPVDPSVLLSLPSYSSEPSVKWQSPQSSPLPPPTTSSKTTTTTGTMDSSTRQDKSKSEDDSEDRRDSLEDVIVVHL